MLKLNNTMLYAQKIQLPVNSGVIALAATIIIWSAYFVALRSGAQSSLTAFDMALLRFVLPAVLLLPILMRARKKLLNVKKRYLAGITIGAGLPFYCLSVFASGHVQAVVGSLLVPGVAPLFVTLLAVLFYRERLATKRMLGLSIVLFGVSVLVMASLTDNHSASWLGVCLYIAAAACWAIYTISIKLAGLTGLELAAFLNSIAAVGLLVVLPFDLFQSNIENESWQTLYPQLLVMGVFCGFVSVVTYGHAINKLGAEISACWGAITPIVVSIFAYIVLLEQVDMSTFLAMLMIMIGVVLANFRYSNSKHKRD